VSAEKALSEYVVALDPKSFVVDVSATQRLRAASKSIQKPKGQEKRS